MKSEKANNLKKAIFTLLNDQYDVPDLELMNSDSVYMDYIVGALIEKNESTCPFKNYDCIGHCKVNHIGCAEGLKIDCNREFEDIWRDFIGIEDEDMPINAEASIKQFVSYAERKGVINADAADKLIKFAKHYIGLIDS